MVLLRGLNDIGDLSALAATASGSSIDAVLNLFLQASNASAAGITIGDCRQPDMPLVYVNPAFLDMTGYQADELLGRNCRFLQGPHTEQPALDEVRAALREGCDCTVLLQNVRKDGRMFWNDLIMAPVRDEFGAPTHYIGIQTDATVRVEAELALQSANELLEQRVSERVAQLTAANAALVLAQHETLDRLALAAEWRDDATGQHAQRVGAVAGLLAEVLGWSAEEARTLARAAILHDVGKIAIPDAILLKPGRLTREEFERMQRHTSMGGAMLAGGEYQLLRLAETIAVGHHEWWDGSGYPQGLAGEAIPVAARIVTIADVFDALIHIRPYKPAWSVASAVAEIVRHAGTQFDPAVVSAFVELHERGLLAAPHWPSNGASGPL